MSQEQVMILGVGNLLFTDEGFGVHVVKRLEQMVTFPDNVVVVDGGVLGVNLLGVISKPDHLIVVDIIRKGGAPGTIYRLEGKEIPERIRAKNSVHQVDFLEALTLVQALDKVPKTVIIGIEPDDMETLEVRLTDTAENMVMPVICKVLEELDRMGISYQKGNEANVSCDPFYDCRHC